MALSPPQWDTIKDLLVYFLLALASFLSGRQFPPAPPQPPPIPAPPPPAPPPAGPRVDPHAATFRLRVGSSGCTATVLSPQVREGEYLVLTASHCIGQVGATGSIRDRVSGKDYPVVFTRWNRNADIAVGTMRTLDALATGKVALETPAPGTVIWHSGFGVDRPGNTEVGEVTGGPDGAGQLKMRLSVSSGDSGSGIFRKDTGELVSVVCCTSGRDTWGSGPEAIRRLISQASWDDPEATFMPVPIPAKVAALKDDPLFEE